MHKLHLLPAANTFSWQPNFGLFTQSNGPSSAGAGSSPRFKGPEIARPSTTYVSCQHEMFSTSNEVLFEDSDYLVVHTDPSLQASFHAVVKTLIITLDRKFGEEYAIHFANPRSQSTELSFIALDIEAFASPSIIEANVKD